MALKYVDEVELEGKKVIARFDFNVPLDKEDPSKITDTTRVDLAIPTIKHILENGASKLILMSHLGRPKGQVVDKFSLEPVAVYLAEALGEDVVLTESCEDAGIANLIDMPKTKIILLQNLRYHAEEEKNDPEFAKLLASYADIYVNDAFGAAHRKHASTYAINAYFKNKNVGGFLIKKELEALTQITETPTKPVMAVVGGAKVADKIKILERLLVGVDKIFIGGAMAYPFLKASGHTVGTSLCSDEDVSLAKSILRQDTGKKVQLPVDHMVSKEFGGAPEDCATTDIADDRMGLDIGPKTITNYTTELRNAKTVFWNGPMGLFENENYNKGTFAIAETLAGVDAFTLVGGGDSVSAVKKSGLAEKFSHVSTGGGASLEFIENGSLPGVQALKFGVDL